jgi:peptidoglycan/LPS O-acetylase OafA/YrhL
LDVLRLAAMGLVASQHLLSVHGITPPFLIGGLDPGALGVTLFCALSGFLAGQASGEGAGTWLGRRLARVYVPYWLSLIAIFTANAALNYKPVTPRLIVSEFAGTVTFTHPNQSVGVHVWFISLLLVCYLLAVAVRLDRRVLPILLAAAAATLVLPDTTLAGAVLIPSCVPAGHVLAFLSGMFVASHRSPLARGGLPVLALVLTGVTGQLPLLCPVVGSVAVLLAGLPRGRSPAPVATLSRGTYEFFLVHGPIYLGLASFAKLALPANAVVGTVLAAAAAWGLRLAAGAVSRAVVAARARAGRAEPQTVT